MNDKTKLIKHKALKVLAICLGAFITICALSFIPILSLKTAGMQQIVGKNVTVHYEKEEAAAKDVLAVADPAGARIKSALGIPSSQNVHIDIYIYDSQSTFKTKKYGFLALLLNLDWYVGDNRGTNVTLTSPAHPGSQHSHDEIVNQVSVHEMVHAYNSVVSSKMPLWINEGLASYLSKQTPKFASDGVGQVPTLAETHTSNPIEFANINGYAFAYTYIEYLNEKYGWGRVVNLARTNNYQQALGVEESAAYNGWRDFVQST